MVTSCNGVYIIRNFRGLHVVRPTGRSPFLVRDGGLLEWEGGKLEVMATARKGGFCSEVVEKSQFHRWPTGNPEFT